MAANPIALSVIIVNYNVRFFLEQCLDSVYRATRDIRAEVYVVDNNSADGSVNMVKARFPAAKIIWNKQNLGFAKANNQALRLAAGEYVLLLNPDTVVQEDSFEKCLQFMQSHPEAGALGVKMIDGKGRFLPESKRSFPSPSVAFYKIFGLSALFPSSRIFGRYHLGYLDRNEIHEIDVLSGAFMFMRMAALEKSGLLDEDYFMYGEDIDLSYKIKQAGYKNYYFPDTTIIHYKGESTRKGKLNYVFTFYHAMIIFVKKHYPSKNARLFAGIIKLAIYFRAFLSILRRSLKALVLPVSEALLIFLGYWLFLPLWEKHVFGGHGIYPPLYLQFVVPSFILWWITSLYFSGGYDRPSGIWSIVKGVLYGTIIILIIYALLPLSLRFSRALILLGAVWTLLVSLGLRYFLAMLFPGTHYLAVRQRKRIVIAGDEQECERVRLLVREAGINHEVAGFVSLPGEEQNENFIGSISQIDEVVRVNNIQEIIFCARNIPSRDIIRYMLALSPLRVDFKIAPQESISIIGSNSINSPGELYVLEYTLIALPSSKRNKRLFDAAVALVLLAGSPLLLFLFRHPLRYLLNVIGVLSGRYSWVGYGAIAGNSDSALPPIKPGILSPSSALKTEGGNEQISKLNLLYARDYKIVNDFQILLRGFLQLDRKPKADHNMT